MSKPIVEARGLTKQFGDLVAVAGIDVAILPGESFGFLGPNGAGKSSTMRMIGCTSPPSGGHLRVMGMDPATDGRQIRSRLGVVPQDDTLDIELTVLENLITYGRYFGLPRRQVTERARELLTFVQLEHRADARVETLSGGMRRRLVVARALVSDPDLVLLDEPTTGLDPQARHLPWDRLRELKRRGVTFILTTHYMDEAEQLCDRLVVMDGGRIVAQGAPADLIATHAGREVVEVGVDPAALDGHADRWAAIADRVEVLSDRVLLYTADADAVATAVSGSDLPTTRVLIRRSTLEDVFLTLTGRRLVE